MSSYSSRQSISVFSLFIVALLLSVASIGNISRQSAKAQANPTATLNLVASTPTIQVAPSEVSFEENKGQFPDGIQYVVSIGAYDAGLTKDGVIFKVIQPFDPSAYPPHPPEGKRSPAEETAIARQTLNPPPPITFDEFRFSFIGLNVEAAYTPEEQQVTTSNYILGSPFQSITEVKHYARVRYTAIYQGIDVLYYASENALHYEFYLAPQADANQLRLHFEDATLKIDPDGSLVIGFGDQANGRQMRKSAPLAYQIIDNVRKVVDAYYVLKDTELTFQLESYDPNVPLIIDPFFTYVGFIGSHGADFIYDLAISNVQTPELYVVGETISTSGFVTVLGPTSGANVFAAKISADGQHVLWQTTIGGQGGDRGYAIQVDSADHSVSNVYITGQTESADFPISYGDTSMYAGNADAFVIILNLSSGSLMTSHLIGGSGRDTGNDIAVDSYMNVYITGSTSSRDFPCSGSVDCSFNSSGDEPDAFITRIGGYSGYIGGAKADQGTALALDATESNVYVVGSTFSSGDTFPINPSTTYMTSYGGSGDAFVAKIRNSQPNDGLLLRSIYLGSFDPDGHDVATGIVVPGEVIISGYTDSQRFTQANFYNHNDNSAGEDCFVFRMRRDLDQLKSSGKIGGSGDDRCYDIVEHDGVIYVSGLVQSAGLGTANMQPDLRNAHGAATDGFVAKIVWPEGRLDAIVDDFGYIGGLDQDYLTAITVDSAHNLYVAGNSWSSVSSAYPTGIYLTVDAAPNGILAKINAFDAPTTPLPDTVGVYRGSTNTFYLHNTLTSGSAELPIPFGLTTDLPIVGDWNADGVDTIGVFRASTAEFFLKNSNDPAAPVMLRYSLGKVGDLPISGDWIDDGIGQSFIGIFRPSTTQFILSDNRSIRYTMSFGLSTDIPVIGDWNGDGLATPGVFRPSEWTFYLTDQLCNTASPENCEVKTAYVVTISGHDSQEYLPLVGDWNGDGSIGVGMFRPSTGEMQLKDTLLSGNPDYTFVIGGINDTPIAGVWEISTYRGP